jgi:ubiquinone/menaquinone biosynthesis C-methylase UbiE
VATRKSRPELSAAPTALTESLVQAKTRAAATYNTACDYYDHPANAFWDRIGARTVERLALKPGQRVLDLCCGAGGSAIPAAVAVGPRGSVLGVDLAENLLALARAKAARQKLRNVEFRRGDMLDSALARHRYDAVICVFGIFFVPEMSDAVKALWQCVAPGGSLAITTWGPRFLEPMSTAFWNAVRECRPDLYRGFNPWDRITDSNALGILFAEAGVPNVHAVLEEGVQPLHSVSDWWAMVLGTGYRATIEALTVSDRDHVREQNLAHVRRMGLKSVETNVIYAVATRPPDHAFRR